MKQKNSDDIFLLTGLVLPQATFNKKMRFAEKVRSRESEVRKSNVLMCQFGYVPMKTGIGSPKEKCAD